MIKITDTRTNKEVIIESDKVKIEDVIAALQLIEELGLEL